MLIDTRKSEMYKNNEYYEYDKPDFKADFQEAQEWAKQKLSEDFYILDTETTGLDHNAEAIEIALLDKDGSIFEGRVKPINSIHSDATAIHGISNMDVIKSPPFKAIHGLLDFYLKQKKILIYDASFDRRILNQQCKMNNLPLFNFESECVMNWYSQYCGNWSEYHQSYIWQKLPSGDHSALGDCKATLAVIKEMAGYETKSI